jgi:hypothetical protein
MEQNMSGKVLSRVVIASIFIGGLATMTAAVVSSASDRDAPSQSHGFAPEGVRSAFLLVAGRPVACTSAGQPVIWVASHQLKDVGMTVPAGQWTVIRYNPDVLDSMPDSIKLFWLGHECGHAYLRTSDEPRADCWSARTGVQQGWFGPSDVGELLREMRDNPGDATHPPGPARVANISNCIGSTR